MKDYKNSNMYQYIQQTPQVLKNIIKRHEIITSNFVERFRQENIQQIYIVGSGTSYHSGLAAKPLLEEIFQIPVRCAYPIPFQNQENVYNKNTLVIGVSQGGQSFSTVYGLDGAKEKGLIRAALSANPTARIFDHAEVSTLLEVGDEFCGAKTKGYASTILTLMLMGMDLAKTKGILSQERYDGYLQRMMKCIENLPSIIDASQTWYTRIHEQFIDTNRVIVVGYDNMYADVLEGTLKILETIRVGVEGYELEEFMHGIYNSVDNNTHIFYLGNESQYRDRIELLHSKMDSLTQHNYMISAKGDADTRNLIIPFVNDELFSNWEFIIPLQMVACIAPIQKGINPDIPADPNFHAKMKSK